MKIYSPSVLAAVVAFPLLVTARPRWLQPRQVSQPSSPAVSGPSIPGSVLPIPSSTGTAPGVSGPVTGSATGTAIPPPIQTTTISFTLTATNPTAVPLSQINANATSAPTRPLDSTAVPGVTPTFLPNGPALPNAALLNPATYPALDKPPPVDSPEVQAWKQEVANSGIIIPNIQPTNIGGCANNTQIVSDTSRCWWTCGGCTRTSDISECPAHMQWGLTYDDGPSPYTSDLLNYLDQVNLKSTFFVVGSRVISFPSILQTQYLGGHQIAAHTWSHPQLTTLSNDEVIAELGWSIKVIKDTLGVTPNMYRPPFGDTDDRVRAIASAMGLRTVLWSRISPTATFDTDDFEIHSGVSPEQVLRNWDYIAGNASTRNTGMIILEHDLFQQSVEIATGYILPDALKRVPSFNIQPVIECLGNPLADAYIETNNNKTNPPAASVIATASGLPGTTQTAGADTNHSNGAVVRHSGFTYPAVVAAIAALASFSL